MTKKKSGRRRIKVLEYEGFKDEKEALEYYKKMKARSKKFWKKQKEFWWKFEKLMKEFRERMDELFEISFKMLPE